jgi:hypothetical protein
MIDVHLPAFYLGVREELEKHAGTDMMSMPVNENILPSINKQTKWKYVRTKDGLKLTDGNLVYSFGGIPEKYPSEDFKIQRGADDNLLNFENDAVSKGTAQIHRASPDNIYMTLADGSQNPTFMLQHEGGQNWRYSPSKKFMQKLKALSAAVSPEGSAEQPPLSVDPEALLAGAQDEVRKTAAFDASSATDLITGGADTVKDFIGSHIAFNAANPLESMVQGYGLQKGLGFLHDKLRPEAAAKHEEQLRRDPKARTADMIDTAANVSLPVLASMAYMAK